MSSRMRALVSLTLKNGDRAAYAVPPMGSYAQTRNYPAEKLLHVPNDMDDKTLAALLMKGLTAQFPTAPYLYCAAGRCHTCSRRRRRDGLDPMPLGAPHRRKGHRHRQHSRKGGDRTCCRVSSPGGAT